MVRHRTRGYATVALLGLLAWGLGGCWNPFAPDPDDRPPPPVEYDLRDTPQHVLDNLVKAYVNKDAEHYLDCLAEDFMFVANPQEVEEHSELEPGYWDKAEERGIHEQMLGDDGAESITLTLTQDGDPIQVDGPTPDDPPEWQYKEAVDLRVHVILEEPTTFLAIAPSLFQLRIDRDQVGPNGETLWEIISWYDLPTGGRATPPSEEQGEVVSLSVLKARFRP